MRQPTIPKTVIESLGNEVELINSVDDNIAIDMLIGLDVYWKCMTPQLVTLSDGLVAQKSLFGWIMSGLLSENHQSSECVNNHQLLNLTAISEKTIQSSWELDDDGIDKKETPVTDPIVDRFEETVKNKDSNAEKQCMAPLPSTRITPAPPFSVAGIDHGGPLFTCDYPGKKFYVLLFTCFLLLSLSMFYVLLLTCTVNRAVHLELVESLSTEATIQAIRRFIARRGRPAVIMSYNAKGFIGAKKKMLSSYGPDSPGWKFTAPLSPWWGGYWERMIGTIKGGLRKSIGKKSLTRVELETFLHEIESCVNSRPLTYTGDAMEGIPLTPAHFLIGRIIDSKSSETDISKQPSNDLALRSEIRNQTLNKFWNVWTKEYIRQLPPIRGNDCNKKLHVGCIVLVNSDQTSRLQWPLGIVQQVFPGRDGFVRSVEIKTAKGLIRRPIQHIHCLELN